MEIMRKILLAIDGPNFPESAFRFIQQVNETQKILLIGAVATTVSQYVRKELEPMAEGMAYDTALFHEQEDDVTKTLDHFKLLCEKHDIEYRVHRDRDYDIVHNLQKESRFADLLVIGTDFPGRQSDSYSISTCLQNILQQAECPVLLIPRKFTFPENVILAYDGSESSLYAIKQFAYLFPELTTLPALLVFASDRNIDIPDLPYVEELATRHYSNITLRKLGLDAKKYFSDWVGIRKAALVVIGSYGRSDLSEAFRKSLAKEIIADQALPVFIAHK